MTPLALLYNILPVRQNKVVLCAVNERYGDNMRYLAMELLRSGRFEIVWVSEGNKVQIPKGIRSVCGTRALRRELSTAHVIVSDGRRQLAKYWQKGFVKKLGQITVRVENGVFPISKGGVDVPNLSDRELSMLTVDAQNVDYLVSGSRRATENYRGNYRFGGKLLEIGTPGNDRLKSVHREQAQKTVRSKYGITPRKRIIVYLPARRPWSKSKFPRLDYAAVLQALHNRFGGDWVLLIRRDPLLSAKGMRWLIPKDNPSVLDAWDYPDTAELFAAADVVLGDYADCTLDFLFTGRPAFLYVPDQARYERECGLYYSMEGMPVPVAGTSKGVVLNIVNFSENHFNAQVSHFLKEEGAIPCGHAAEQIVNEVVQILSRGERKENRALATSSHRIGGLLKWFFSYRRAGREHIEICFLGLRFRVLVSYKPPFHPFDVLPIENGKIVISEFANGYSGHGKYIVEEIKRRKLPWKIVWVERDMNQALLENRNTFPENIKVVIRGTDEADYEYETAQIWLDSVWRSDNYRRGIQKKEGQTYIQLGHGSLGIKKINLNIGTFNYRKALRRGEEDVDYLLSNSAFETNWWHRVLGRGNGCILQIGHPRNDLLFQEDTEGIHRKVCEQLGISHLCKIVLYAPTWRPTQSSKWDVPDYERLTKALGRHFGGEWVVVARMHRVSCGLEEAKLQSRDRNVINASTHADVQELLAAADCVITDYSSTIFEYVQTRRPGFLYMTDRVTYRGNDGSGLEYQPEETPFPIATNDDELERNILRFNENQYRADVETFLKRKGSIDDGHASERFVNFLETILKKKTSNE